MSLVKKAAQHGMQQRNQVTYLAEQSMIQKKIQDLDNKNAMSKSQTELFRQKTFKAQEDEESLKAVSEIGMLQEHPSNMSNMIAPETKDKIREVQKSAMVQIKYNRTNEDIERGLRERFPELQRDERLHKGIGDWEHFYDKLKDQKYAFPSQFIHDKIDINSWRNIPIPLQEATEQFEQCFVNLSNIILEIMNEQQTRSTLIAMKLKEMSKTTETKSVRLQQQIQAQRKALSELIEDFKDKSDNALEQQKLKLDFLHNEINKDRQYLQTRLMHMDDTVNIKKWVHGEIMRLETQLRNEYKLEFRRLDFQIDKIWNENLLIPEMIGDNELCLYKNLQEYCKASKSEFSQFRDEFEPTVNRKISDKILQVKNPLNIKMNDCKKEVHELRTIVERIKRESREAFEKEKQQLEDKLADVLPQLERELKTMQEQHSQFVELPQRVQLATENLEDVQQRLEHEMKTLDVNTSNRIDQLKEELLDKFTKDHGELDTKINDVERKTMAFAQRAASGQGEQKGKSNMKDALKSKMKTRYGGLLNKPKGAPGLSGLIGPNQLQTHSLYSQSSELHSPNVRSSRRDNENDLNRTNILQTVSPQDDEKADVLKLQNQMMEQFRKSARQFFLMKRDMAIKRKQEASKLDRQTTQVSANETEFQKRQQALIKEASPLPRQNTDQQKPAVNQDSIQGAKEDTDITQDRTMITPKGGASLKLELQQSQHLASVKEKSENSGAPEANKDEQQKAIMTQSSFVSVKNPMATSEKSQEQSKPELKKKQSQKQESEVSRKPPLSGQQKDDDQQNKKQNAQSFQDRLIELEKEKLIDDQERSSQKDEMNGVRSNEDKQREALKLTIEQTSATPMAAQPRSLDHESKDRLIVRNATTSPSNENNQDKDETRNSISVGEVGDQTVVVPDQAMLPLLDQSNESNIYHSYEKKDKSKVKFKEEDESFNEEFLLRALQFNGIEKMILQRVEEQFLRYFGPGNKKDDKVRNLITQAIKTIMDKHLTSQLDAKIEKQFRTHVNNHQVDPTLLSLIQNFVPGMKNIELKKEPAARDKRGIVDRNKKKNHVRFQKVYTSEGINFYGEVQSPLHYNVVSDPDLLQMNTEPSMPKQQFKENDIFDVLTSDDRELIDKSFGRGVVERSRRNSQTNNERYAQQIQPGEATQMAQQHQSNASKTQTLLDAESKTMGDHSITKKVRDVSQMGIGGDGHPGNQGTVMHRVEFTDLTQPLSIELKTNRVGQRRPTMNQAPHPKSAATTRKYSEFQERPMTHNTLRQNIVSRSRFKAHEATGLVDPNSLNEMPTTTNAMSTTYAHPPDIASARILNPINHQMLHNFGFAEETMSKEALVDGSGLNNSGILYPPHQRRVFSQERMWPNQTMKVSQDATGTPPLVDSEGKKIIANLRQEINNCGKSTGNLTGVGMSLRNKQLVASSHQRMPSSPRYVNHQFMTTRALQQKSFIKQDNSRPGSIRESNLHDESHGEFENDLGLSCRQTGIKTQIPGFAGGILALQETRGQGTQGSDHDAMSGSAMINPSLRNKKKGQGKSKKTTEVQGTLSSSAIARDKVKGKSQSGTARRKVNAD